MAKCSSGEEPARFRSPRRIVEYAGAAIDARRGGTAAHHRDRRRERFRMITVVAALIEADGKVLVCQRRRGDTFGLMWEFPGGKLKPGETPAQALERELHEELGVR